MNKNEPLKGAAALNAAKAARDERRRLDEESRVRAEADRVAAAFLEAARLGETFLRNASETELDVAEWCVEKANRPANERGMFGLTWSEIPEGILLGLSLVRPKNQRATDRMGGGAGLVYAFADGVAKAWAEGEAVK